MIKKKINEIIIIALSALLLILSFPVSERISNFLPHWHWELGAFFAFIPIFFLIQKKTYRAAFTVGYFWGFLFFFGTLSWIIETMVHYGNMSIILSYSILTLLALYLAIYIGVFFLLTRFIIDKLNLPLALIAPPLWVILEFHRSWIISGFPWNSLAYSQYKNLIFIQSADIFGIWGLSFLIILINAFFFDIFFNKQSKTKKIIILIITSLILFSNLYYGKVKLSENIKGDSMLIALIQGNFKQEEKWQQNKRSLTLNTYIELSHSVCEKKLDLIVWPEAAIPFMLRYSGDAFSKISRLARDCKTDIVVGSPDRIDKNNKVHFYNSAFLITPDGNLTNRYDKMHLVPFGEYVPLQRFLFFIEKLTDGAVGNFSEGKDYTVFKHSKFPFSVYICYETIFPDQLRIFIKKGARFLVSITNDAWFGRSAASYQHFSMTIFRAIENRCPVVRAANTGISGSIDKFGKIRLKSQIFTKTVLTDLIKVSPQQKLTLYTRYGDWFIVFCSFIIIFISVLLIL